MLKCQLCDYETDKQQKLSKHTSFIHKLKFPEYLIQTKYNGENRLCECGCGSFTNYNPKNGDFFEFIVGHNSRKEGHWGDWDNPDRVNKIKSTRKAKFKSGEYDYIRNAVKENRKQPTLGKNISKGAKGIPKPKPKGFRVGKKHSKKTKEKMSNSAINRIVKEDKLHISKLEYEFQKKFFR